MYWTFVHIHKYLLLEKKQHTTRQIARDILMCQRSGMKKHKHIKKWRYRQARARCTMFDNNTWRWCGSMKCINKLAWRRCHFSTFGEQQYSLVCCVFFSTKAAYRKKCYEGMNMGYDPIKGAGVLYVIYIWCIKISMYIYIYNDSCLQRWRNTIYALHAWASPWYTMLTHTTHAQWIHLYDTKQRYPDKNLGNLFQTVLDEESLSISVDMCMNVPYNLIARISHISVFWLINQSVNDRMCPISMCTTTITTTTTMAI